jgi:hypothetical protein
VVALRAALEGWHYGFRTGRGLNQSNQQVARELDLNVGDVQAMTEELRAGILAARPAETLAGVVECDEIYVTAGHKGQPAAVAKKSPRPPARPERLAGPGHLEEGEASDLRHG